MARGKGKDGGATLIDVAAAAGVSVITASRALRGQGPMSDETRDRVRRAAESLSYRRNPIAASLVSSSSNLVGVIVPSLANIVFVDVLAGIDAAIAPAGVPHHHRRQQL
jgi:LacI family gluconate utilization system Gnt-I transcriptional repressor